MYPALLSIIGTPWINIFVCYDFKTYTIFFFLQFIPLEDVKYAWLLSQHTKKLIFEISKHTFRWYVRYHILEEKHWTTPEGLF